MREQEQRVIVVGAGQNAGSTAAVGHSMARRPARCVSIGAGVHPGKEISQVQMRSNSAPSLPS